MEDHKNTPNPEQEKKMEDSSFNPKEQAKDMIDDVKGMSNVKPGDFKPGKIKGMPTALIIIQILLILSAIGSLFGGVYGIIGTVIALITVWGINKRAMWAYWLLIIFILYSIVITLVNWMGYGYVSLVIDAVLLYYITKSKSWFMPQDKA
ncbi:MAG: hypothetical protein ACNFW9_02095 [Candidatus Kerfeldbacteria bacterium]